VSRRSSDPSHAVLASTSLCPAALCCSAASCCSHPAHCSPQAVSRQQLVHLLSTADLVGQQHCARAGVCTSVARVAIRASLARMTTRPSEHAAQPKPCFQSRDTGLCARGTLSRFSHAASVATSDAQPVAAVPMAQSAVPASAAPPWAALSMLPLAGLRESPSRCKPVLPCSSSS